LHESKPTIDHGLQFAKQLLEKGNTVIAAVRDPEAAKLQELKSANPKCIPTRLDAGDLSSIQEWASKLSKISPTVDVRLD
jgi:short-subunit dehydrogenase involved in D-alanine esterification of teichoic acids